MPTNEIGFSFVIESRGQVSGRRRRRKLRTGQDSVTAAFEKL